jgi:hypothetical protein
VLLIDYVVETPIATREEAHAAWRRCLEDLDEPARYFGPDVDLDLHPGERHYRLVVDQQTIGLGWVRRFTKAGHIRSYGFALYPEARNRRFSQPASAAVITAIFEDYPETTTVIAMIYGSNPHKRWNLSQGGLGRSHYVGEIVEATSSGVSLHIAQVTRKAWRGEMDDPEPEWRGAPHVHRET